MIVTASAIMLINEKTYSLQPSDVITPKLLKKAEKRSVETAENVLTYGGQCPPCCSLPDFPPSLMEGVTIFPICKPYIFHTSGLLNTEIIITAILKPLIFLPKSVGIYGGRLQRLRKHIHHKPIPLPAKQAVPPTATTSAAAVSTTIMITRR